MVAIVPAMAQGSNDEAHYYSVLFSTNSIPADFEGQLASMGAELVYAVEEIGFAQVKGDAGALSKMKGLSSVKTANPTISWSVPETERIELDSSELTVKEASDGDVNTDNAALWGLQWDIQRITENGTSYELGTGSHDVVVGIVDTGIDRDHPDLVGNLLPGSKNFVPAGGFRGTEPTETGDINDYDDEHGHGSHVAGSIAGNGAMLGVAPNTGIRAYRVFGCRCRR
jgi:subtilisin family serine protease